MKMERKITMWRYPYGLRTFGRNVKQYGLASSLRHDWDRTKENMQDRLESIVESVAFGIIMTIATPVIIYSCYKIVKDSVKRIKKEEE